MYRLIPLLPLILLLTSVPAVREPVFAQPPPSRFAPAAAETREEVHFPVTEVTPRFRGGDLHTFRRWAQAELHYPEEAHDKRIEGRVLVAFSIETDGSVSTVRALKSPHPLLSEEAVRVVSRSPRWTPGRVNGRLVRMQYVLPLDFEIQ